MLKQLRQNMGEWLEGIKRPDRDVVEAFVLLLGDLEVGRLKFENDHWEFRYSEKFREQSELEPLTDFPDLDETYLDKDLWPFFSQRIPSLQQPAVQEFMNEKHLEEVDPVTLLRQFGQRTVANPFELEALPA